MIVDSVEVGPIQATCYLVTDRDGGTGMVIDPGDEPDLILAMIARHRVTVTQILLTHGHLDHVLAVDAVRKATGAPVSLGQKDLPLYEMVPAQAAAFDMKAVQPGRPDKLLAGGETFRVGGLSVKVIATPGHSPGGVCYLVSDAHGSALFSGDTLFAGGIGRTDLWGGSHKQLLESIRLSILTLDAKTPVYPGHGEATTVGDERDYNLFLHDEM